MGAEHERKEAQPPQPVPPTSAPGPAVATPVASVLALRRSAGNGTAVDHDAATRKMTDASGTALPGAVVENNNNIMSVGGEVRPQHYSTFHEALRAITGIEEWALGPKQARPAAPGGP